MGHLLAGVYPSRLPALTTFSDRCIPTVQRDTGVPCATKLLAYWNTPTGPKVRARRSFGRHSAETGAAGARSAP